MADETCDKGKEAERDSGIARGFTREARVCRGGGGVQGKKGRALEE